MTRPTMEEQIKALTWLRNGWDGDNSERAIEAFDTLDNAEVFAEIDDEIDAREAATAPRTPVAIMEHGPLFQARGADGRIWTTATTYKLVEQNLAESAEPFIIVAPEELSS